MNRLVFPDGEWINLRAKMRGHAPDEAAAIVLARPGRGREGVRFIASQTFFPQASDHVEQTSSKVVLQPGFIAGILKKARTDDLSFFLLHTHPFQDVPTFSHIDSSGEAVLAPALYGRAPRGPHGSIVIGNAGFCGRTLNADGSHRGPLPRIGEVGADVRVYCADQNDDPISAVYDRNVRAFGREGQRVLGRLHVGVVGVGGTGSFVVEELSRLGVGRLTLIDDEVIETTNLNRVLGSVPRDVGRPKVRVLASLARRIRPDIGVRAVRASITREPIARRLLDCDAVFCCTDSHGSRAVINQIAYQYFLPVFDIGVRIDAEEGSVAATVRAQMLAPGLSCLACHPLLDPDAVRRDLMTDQARKADPYIVGFHEPQPAVVSINGTITSAAITMFLCAVTGLPSSTRHLVGRPLEGTMRAATSNPRTDCVVCGQGNALGRADSWPVMWTS
jgi:hypothetical protein